MHSKPNATPGHGSKIAVFYDGKILLYQRDDLPYIPHPNRWDYPGGGQEPDESLFECAQRELEEEFVVRPTLTHIRDEPHELNPETIVSLYTAELTDEDMKRFRFTGEGQHYKFATKQEFLETDVIDQLKNFVLSLPDPPFA